MDKIAVGKNVKTFWIDPKTGASVTIGRFSNRGVDSFSTPENWDDALLVMETADD